MLLNIPVASALYNYNTIQDEVQNEGFLYALAGQADPTGLIRTMRTNDKIEDGEALDELLGALDENLQLTPTEIDRLFTNLTNTIKEEKSFVDAIAILRYIAKREYILMTEYPSIYGQMVHSEFDEPVSNWENYKVDVDREDYYRILGKLENIGFNGLETATLDQWMDAHNSLLSLVNNISPSFRYLFKAFNETGYEGFLPSIDREKIKESNKNRSKFPVGISLGLAVGIFTYYVSE